MRINVSLETSLYYQGAKNLGSNALIDFGQKPGPVYSQGSTLSILETRNFPGCALKNALKKGSRLWGKIVVSGKSPRPRGKLFHAPLSETRTRWAPNLDIRQFTLRHYSLIQTEPTKLAFDLDRWPKPCANLALHCNLRHSRWANVFAPSYFQTIFFALWAWLRSASIFENRDPPCQESSRRKRFRNGALQFRPIRSPWRR